MNEQNIAIEVVYHFKSIGLGAIEVLGARIRIMGGLELIPEELGYEIVEPMFNIYLQDDGQFLATVEDMCNYVLPDPYITNIFSDIWDAVLFIEAHISLYLSEQTD